MNRSARFLMAVLLLAGGAVAATAAVSPPATAASPAASPAAPQLFEMRTYTTHPGRLDALNRRFRDHTMRLFEKHGMVNVAYWVPRDSARADNTLIYILAYPSREARDASWRAFNADPEWQAARAASEADGPIVQRLETVFMDPTSYSPLQ